MKQDKEEQMEKLEGTEKKVMLETIRIDGDTQPRKKLYVEKIKEYSEQMLDGDVFTPVTIFFDGKHNWLADGFHRYHASKKAGYADIFAYVINGTKRDAWVFSKGANAKHGIPRTTEELRDIVISVLDDIEYGVQTARQVAAICNTSHTTVNRIKKSLELIKKSKEAPPPTTGGDSKPKGGTTKPQTPAAPPPTSETASEEYDPDA